MTTYDWQPIRERLTQHFDKAPDSTLEERIIDVFKHQPALVDNAARDVEKGYKEGRISNPWRFLLSIVENAARRSNVTAEDTTERETAERKTTQWIKAAGLHFDLEAEIEDELFGERGRLLQWADDTELRANMLQLWRNERPRGEQTEHDHEAYMAKFKRERETLNQTAKQPTPSRYRDTYLDAGPGDCDDCKQPHQHRRQYHHVQLCDPCLDLRLKTRSRTQQPAETT